ncbi:hypothetical protein BH11PSE9_BH11PSE9_27290 [soil metagenome]
MQRLFITYMLSLSACLGTVPAISCAAEPMAASPAEWPTASPESQGMRSAALAALIDNGQGWKLDSLLVARHGRIVAEAYYAPYRAGMPHTVNSVTKSVVGTLAAIALKNGTIASRDLPVLDLLAGSSPSLSPTPRAANIDERKRSLTLSHLLDMSSGLDWTEPLDGAPISMLQMRRSADWVQFVLDRPMRDAPGARFDYNSGSTHLLSAILTKQTGRSTLAYAREQLFEPLGITDVIWRQDPQGIYIGGWGLYLQPRDMARIGQLYLQGGVWAGQPLLPAGWIEHINASTTDMRMPGPVPFRYGNLWWTLPSRQAYMAVGFKAQNIVVLPTLDAVVVTTGRAFVPIPRLIDAVAAAVAVTVQSADALPEDAAGRARLRASTEAAAVEKPTPAGKVPPIATSISGKTFTLAANPMRASAFKLDLDGAQPRYEIAFEAGTSGAAPPPMTGPLGLDGLFRTTTTAQGRTLAAKGTWRDEATFVVTLRTLGDSDEFTYALRFDGDAVEVRFDDSTGYVQVTKGQAVVPIQPRSPR